jgi:DNA-binding response OmpR family regulator
MQVRQKLLVIEPDADTAQLLDESLSAQGYDVRLTDSAGGRCSCCVTMNPMLCY